MWCEGGIYHYVIILALEAVLNIAFGDEQWHSARCCSKVAKDYGFLRVSTTEELDVALPHAAPFSVATTSGARKCEIPESGDSRFRGLGCTLKTPTGKIR